MQDIVTQYSGNASRSPEGIAADGEHMKIVVVEQDGSWRVVFQGSQFSEGKFKKRMTSEGREPYIEELRRRLAEAPPQSDQ